MQREEASCLRTAGSADVRVVRRREAVMVEECILYESLLRTVKV